MELPFVNEGKVTIRVPTGSISKKLPVFYNPAMKLNRDVTIALFNSLGRSGLKGCDLLAGSGVRSIRLLKEAKWVFEQTIINDANPLAVKAVKKHLALNKVPPKRVIVTNLDANKLLANSAGFDYIDIDPFGSPNPFLDQSLEHLARDGILAVTATDTAALSGTSPAACKRKYWAIPLHCHMMHEIALRILIRKCQLIGAQYDKALTPIVSYAKEHYVRVMLRCAKGKKCVDDVLKQQRYIHYCRRCLNTAVSEKNCGKCVCGNAVEIAGPCWTGALGEPALLRAMAKHAPSEQARELLELLSEENAVNQVGFHDSHELARSLRIGPPATELVHDAIRNAGYNVARAHYTPLAFKTNMPLEKVKRLIARL